MSKVMSVGMYAPAEVDQEATKEQRPQVRTIRSPRGWDPDIFAREQIRGLVRQVFFSHAAPPVRQVVFTPVDAETDVHRLCRRAAESLAFETQASVALAGEYPRLCEEPGRQRRTADDDRRTTTNLRQTATRLRANLWLVPLDRQGEDSFSTVSLHSFMCGLQREFEYSILESAPAGESCEATAMAEPADGVILVVSAHHTRRAMARNIKERLEAAQARILGIVLSERMFPIPERIYRRL
jgi:hypothetical protein